MWYLESIIRHKWGLDVLPLYHTALWEDVLMKTLVLKHLNISLFKEFCKAFGPKDPWGGCHFGCPFYNEAATSSVSLLFQVPWTDTLEDSWSCLYSYFLIFPGTTNIVCILPEHFLNVHIYVSKQLVMFVGFFNVQEWYTKYTLPLAS